MRTALLLSVLLAALPAVLAQEHPEHPKSAPKAKSFSVDDLEASIKQAIAAKEKEGGGVYKLYDKAADKTWALMLDHVHRERLSRLDEHTYFACTDFKASDGSVVDVDFFMREKGDELVLDDATVHKVDGKARYNWEEKDGYWHKVPVKS